MFFLGYNFLGADELTCPVTPTLSKESTTIELSSVKTDVLSVTDDITFTPTAEIDRTWDWDTILLADFNGDSYAGNVKWVIDKLEYILIKRRIVGEYKWTTIAIKEMPTDREITEEDYNLTGTDLTAESLVYEYAIVPIIDGIEGEYASITLDLRNYDLVLLDKTGIYHTPITEGYCDTTDVHPNSVIEPLHNRYPTVVRNTLTNYETIQVEGNFIPVDDNNCTYFEASDDDRTRVLYQREVKEFLTNGRTKILKNVDGQCWLVYVTTPPTDSADGTYNVRKLSFGCTEIGSLKSESDLYYAGLLDVPEEWWSNPS